MKSALCTRARCIAARSQGLYKAEEFIPCYSDLDLNTTTAGKLITLQRVTWKVQRISNVSFGKGDVGLLTWINLTNTWIKDCQYKIHHSQRQRGSIEGSQRKISHSAIHHTQHEEIISLQGGMPLHGHSGSKKKAFRSHTGWELWSFVADCMNKYAKAGSDSKTIFDDIYASVLVQAFKGNGRYSRTRVLTIDTFQHLRAAVWRQKS